MTPARRAVTVLIAASLATLLITGGLAWQRHWRAVAVGAELFDGGRPLPARIQGHDQDLPPLAARCTNCHAGAGAAAAEVSAPAAFGPPLTAATLTTPQARRGGPPSRYDAAALCRLLRTGIDPAYVQINRAMPRYRVADADCEALWAWLEQR